MRIITGNRGCGKTFQLVKDANSLISQGHKVVMLVGRPSEKDTFSRYGLNEKAEVLTFRQYQDKYIGTDCNVDILIDEAQFVLKDILKNNVATITIDKEDIIDLTDIKKED